MKVTKPKKNQILFEDDIFIDFDTKVKNGVGLNAQEYNEEYEALVIGYRFPNMDASKQMFYGTEVSIMALWMSMLENLITHGVVSEKEVKTMVKMCLKNAKRKGD